MKSKIHKKIYGNKDRLEIKVIIQTNGKDKVYDASQFNGFVFGGFSSRFWIAKNQINLKST